MLDVEPTQTVTVGGHLRGVLFFRGHLLLVFNDISAVDFHGLGGVFLDVDVLVDAERSLGMGRT